MKPPSQPQRLQDPQLLPWEDLKPDLMLAHVLALRVAVAAPEHQLLISPTISLERYCEPEDLHQDASAALWLESTDPELAPAEHAERPDATPELKSAESPWVRGKSMSAATSAVEARPRRSASAGVALTRNRIAKSPNKAYSCTMMASL